MIGLDLLVQHGQPFNSAYSPGKENGASHIETLLYGPASPKAPQHLSSQTSSSSSQRRREAHHRQSSRSNQSRRDRHGNKDKNKTEVVKFSSRSHTKPSRLGGGGNTKAGKDDGDVVAGSLFPKEPVPVNPPTPTKVASSLAKELFCGGSSALNQRSVRRPGDTQTRVMVLFPESAAIKPLELEVDGRLPVERVVKQIMEAATSAQSRGNVRLQGRTQNDYELRMVDDDDNTPDYDFPPLQRDRPFYKFEIRTVALCLIESSSSIRERAVSVGMENYARLFNPQNHADFSEKFFVKVIMPGGEKHVLAVRPGMRLEDLLPMIAKKTLGETLSTQHWNFHYLNDPKPLPPGMRTQELTIDEISLRRKEFFKSKATSDSSGFNLTPETARAYHEYVVLKTNRHGRRQRRIIGIDGQYIYNKKVDEKVQDLVRKKVPDVISNHFSPVKNAMRAISDVVQVSPYREDDEKSFKIVYRTDVANAFTIYQAASKEEMSEIVARIAYLMKLTAARPDMVRG